MQKILPKKELSNFIKSLTSSYDVYAPIKDRNTKFAKVQSLEEMHLDALTEVTAKQLFIPEGEVLVEFNEDGTAKEVIEKIPKRVIFGMRKCDLNSIQILDKVMFDPQYLTKRNNSILVGLFCDSPDEYCFCNSMELTNFHDLFFYPQGDNYIIEVGSPKGEELVKSLPNVEQEIQIPDPMNSKDLGTKDIGPQYRNTAWESDTAKCLSCGACTFDCPTCNCFDIRDESSVDGKSAKRTRKQVSCMTKSFSRVGGGKSHRESRLARFKHFVYHKIVYYKKVHGRPMCVGCGRCLRVCPTKIDWVDTINLMNDVKGEPSK